MGDSYEHVYMALNIKDHFLFYSANAALPLQAKYYTLRPPMYSLFLLIVYFFTVNNWLVLVLQNILSVFNIMYLRKAISSIGFDKKYDWILLLFLVMYPAQFIYANTIAPDLLLQTFVLIYFAQFILLLKNKTPRHAWIMSLVLVLGMFTKPILYPFVFVHAVIVAWLCFGYRVSKKSLVAVLLPLLCILLYNTWNLERTGKFHFTSIQPLNAMYYNVRMYKEYTEGYEVAKAFMTKEKAIMEGQPTFRDWYNYGDERSAEILKENVLPYFLFHLRGVAQFFIHPGKGELDLYTGKMSYGSFYQKKDKRIMETLRTMPLNELPTYFIHNLSVPAMFLILFFNFIKLVGFLAFLFIKRIHFAIRLFTFVLLGYFAFVTGPLANTRYCLPVAILFIGCGTIGICSLYLRLMKHRCKHGAK